MNYLGFSLNVITLLALSLVIGILVDDAIVEVENIVRHLQMGKTPMQAAMEAADEIGLAVVATTFTLIAVFLPTAFMSGIAGKFFKQFGWTASLAVFASLVVAWMLTPMMAAYLLKPITKPIKVLQTEMGQQDGIIMHTYLRATVWCTHHRWWTALGSLLFFMGSLGLIGFLSKGFIPPDDNSQTQVRLELPPGTTLLATQQAAEQVRLLLRAVPHVKSVYTTVGSGSAGVNTMNNSGGSEVRNATLTILLSPRGQRPPKQSIENQIRVAMAQVAGVRSTVGLGGSGEKYTVVLSSNQPEVLNATAQTLGKELRGIVGLGAITSSAALVRPEVVVRPDFPRMADLGVTSTGINEALRLATAGDYPANLPKLNLGDRKIPIVTRLDKETRNNLTALAQLTIRNNMGQMVALSQVATLQMEGGTAVINRLNRAHNVSFDIEVSGKPLCEVADAINALPILKDLPAEVKQLTQGDAEVMQELFASFGLAMGTGVLCIYMVLVLLFKSFLQPMTILAALPLALGGAFVGLLLAQKMLSMPSMIGLIMLMGVSTKNSILLVEYAIEHRRLQPDLSVLDALIDACHKRARPIVMTTLAMGAGMLPIAMEWGAADGSFRAPMAVAVIGGLVTSTVLSLLVIPSLYTFMEDLPHLPAWLLRRWRAWRVQTKAKTVK